MGVFFFLFFFFFLLLSTRSNASAARRRSVSWHRDSRFAASAASQAAQVHELTLAGTLGLGTAADAALFLSLGKVRKTTAKSSSAGPAIRERKGHGEQDILGTSITCSAKGKSRIRRVSVAFTTGCGTGASRICTKGQMSAMCSEKCRSSLTCGPRGTPRQGGLEPPCGRSASGTPPSPLLALLCPRGAAW